MLPLALWLAYMAVALIMGFTQLVNTSVELLLGDIPIFFAVIFGIWVGRRTFKVMGDYMKVALINGFILSLAIGAISIIFILVLAQSSAAFAQSYGQLGAAPSQYSQSVSLTTILESGIASWIKIVLVTIAAAAMGFEFSSKK